MNISVQLNNYDVISNYNLTKYNRPVNNNKLTKTIQDYENNFEQNSKIDIYDYIHVGNIYGTNEKLILDGQHRFEAIKYLTQNTSNKKLQNYLQNRYYEIKYYDNISTVEELCKLINTINDRQAYTFNTQQQKVRPIFESQLKDYFTEKLPDVKQTQCSIRHHIGSLHIGNIVSIVCNNEILVNIFNNYIDEGNIEKINTFFDTIIDYNNLIVNKFKVIIENNELNLNQKLNELYKISKNDKLIFDNLKETNIKKDIYETIKKQTKKNFVLNIIKDRDYEYWLNPIITKFIE